MVDLMLSSDQVKVLMGANGIVVLRDPDGHEVASLVSPGVVEPHTDQDIQQARQSLAASNIRYTTAEVLAHLLALESQQP